MASSEHPQEPSQQVPQQDALSEAIHKASSPSYNPSSYVPREQGTTGLRHMSGYIDEEDIRELRWPHCVKVYRQMESDPLIHGALFAIRQFIKSSEWKVEEYKGQDKPKDAAQQKIFLEQCIDDLNTPWSTFLDNALSMLVYGFSVHEISYKRRNGWKRSRRDRSKFNDAKIGWRGFPIRSQDTITEWGFDKWGDVNWVRQEDQFRGTDVKIPEDRFMNFRASTYKDNPEGRSILRSIYRGYYSRRNVEIQEGIGIERDLSGLPIIKIPSEYMSGDATEDQKAIANMYANIGNNLKRNEQGYVLMPSDIYGNGENASGDNLFEIELLSASGNRQVDTTQVIGRLNQTMMQGMLTDFLLLGGSVGSYALSSNKVMAFTTAIESYLDVIAEQFNDKAIPLLWELNGMDPAKAPKLVHTGVENIDLEILGNFLKNAAAAGVITPDDELEDAIRGRANLPSRNDGTDEEAQKRAARREEANQRDKVATSQGMEEQPSEED